MASHLPGVPPASLGEMLSPKTPLQTKKQLFGGTTIEKRTVKRNRPITYSFRVSERERRIIDEKVRELCMELIEYITIGAKPGDKTGTREIHIYYKLLGKES